MPVLQFLHSVGLLRAAFRPEGDVCAVRSMMRYRTELVEMTSQHILHMHKALTQRRHHLRSLQPEAALQADSLRKSTLICATWPLPEPKG
jgi:hypothetical protein